MSATDQPTQSSADSSHLSSTQSKPLDAESLRENRREFALRTFILVLICLVSFSIRLFSVLRYESIIHEFDPWFNFRSTRYVEVLVLSVVIQCIIIVLSSSGFLDLLFWLFLFFSCLPLFIALHYSSELWLIKGLTSFGTGSIRDHGIHWGASSVALFIQE